MSRKKAKKQTNSLIGWISAIIWLVIPIGIYMFEWRLLLLLIWIELTLLTLMGGLKR